MIFDMVVDSFQASTYRNPEQWFLDWFNGGTSSDSGVSVGPASAMKYAPYFQAISLISGDVGKIPLPLYERTSEGRERDRKHRAYRLMMHEFSDTMTADVGKQVLQAHALGWGNGRGALLRDNAMNPLAIVPLLPDRTRTEVYNSEIWHITKINDGQEERAYRDENVLHIKGLGFDGITGYSVAHMAKNSLGLGMAAEKHGSSLFKNGAIPGILLKTDGKVSPSDAKQLIQDWDRWHSGPENIGRTGLLHSGIDAKTLAMNSKDAEWLETRKFQRVEVASWFNLPPHKLGDDGRQSYNSLEQENLSYREGCLLFWFVRWQNECRRKLLTEVQKEQDSHYFEFLSDMFASVDLQAKVSSLTQLVASKILNSNEAREKLNMNHRPGGDVYENPNTGSSQEAKSDPKPPEPAKKPPSKAKMLDAMASDPRFAPKAGPIGPMGPKGDKGDAGERGEAGEVGAIGPRGEQGIQGEAGPQGIPGERGEIGLTGPKGDTGEQGPQGIQGIQGERGADGEIGPKGDAGEPGIAGPKGDKGEIGPIGPVGERGEQGPIGETGPAGAKGDTGERGERGLPGIQGERGERGEAGERGPQGEVGPMGERGKDGLPGEVGPIGPAGAQGAVGESGPRGERGLRGESGPPSLYGRALDVLSAAVAREVSTVRHHASHAKNFTRWFETWYVKWGQAFAAEVRRLGSDESLAAEHCAESQRQLVALTETATQDTLVSEVNSLTGSWAERAVVLARRIAGGELPNAAIEPETLVSTPHGLGKVVRIEDGWRYEVELQDGTRQTFGGGDMEVMG